MKPFGICTFLFLIALLAAPAPVGAGQFDYLDLGTKKGQQLSYAGDTYYSAKPWIWVSSSDGGTYDGFNSNQLFFRVNASYEYTTPALFQEPTFKLRFSGGGFTKQEFYLLVGSNDYTTGYLPPGEEI